MLHETCMRLSPQKERLSNERLQCLQEPSIITSYGREGRLSAISTKVLTKSLDGSDVESRAVVGFHLNPNPHVEESAVKSARCKLETLDDGGVQMALQADLHYSYPVRHTSRNTSCTFCLVTW